MQLITTEAWVRFLRKLYSTNAKGNAALLEVEVSPSYPFTDIPENSNLANDPKYASFTDGVVRKPGRRAVNPPEVTVHNAGEAFPKKYMDNYISGIHTHDIELPEQLRDKIALVKSVFLEQEDGSLFILKERDHYIFDRERHAITFHSEYFGLVPIGAVVFYCLELYTENNFGQTEFIDSGVVKSGEQIGVVYALEGDATTQLDFWGGDTKQTEWLLQRFKRTIIDEKRMRQDLAQFGLVAFNVSWDHGGINKSLDMQLRPYLWNITATIRYTTEYKIIQMSPEFLNKFDLFSGGDWRGEIVATYDEKPIRYYIGTIAPKSPHYFFLDKNYNEDDPATYTISRGSSIPFEKA